MRPLDDYIKAQLNEHIDKIEQILNGDCLTIISPILPGLDNRVRDVIESISSKQKSLIIIHHTPGGIVEVVARMVEVIRHYYSDVVFIIPDKAMSAAIYSHHLFCLLFVV